MKEYMKKYCVGCGLCQSLGKAYLQKDDDGFLRLEGGDEEWLENICPASGKHISELSKKELWGKNVGVYHGWAIDSDVRRKAASGGILTEIASFLLETNKVDGVIHISENKDNPYSTISCISRTRNELLQRCGSRYAISHPLELFNQLDINERYAFIGKPCDIVVLRNYMAINKEVKNLILYLLSFFCMGLPSDTAQIELAKRLKCSVEQCERLTYRGNGWPGLTVAIDKAGEKHTIDYGTSWGEILGRDVMKMCRFCIDGIGELADISCCDAWYRNESGKPDFSEHEGRNAIFVRNDVGKSIIEEMRDLKKIYLDPYIDYADDLLVIQKSQASRRQFMYDRMLITRIFGGVCPDYQLSFLKGFSKGTSYKKRIYEAFRTCRRIIKKRM